jgi:hypothetical protein
MSERVIKIDGSLGLILLKGSKALQLYWHLDFTCLVVLCAVLGSLYRCLLKKFGQLALLVFLFTLRSLGVYSKKFQTCRIQRYVQLTGLQLFFVDPLICRIH